MNLRIAVLLICIPAVFCIVTSKNATATNSYSQYSSFSGSTIWAIDSALVCTVKPFANTTLNSQTSNTIFIGNWFSGTDFIATQVVDWIQIKLFETTNEPTDNIIVRLRDNCGEFLGDITQNTTGPWNVTFPSGISTGRLVGSKFGFEIAKYGANANVELGCVTLSISSRVGTALPTTCPTPSPTPSPSFISTSSSSSSPSPYVSGSSAPSASASPTSTGSGSSSPTVSASPSASPIYSGTPSASSSPSPTSTGSGSSSPTVSASPSASPITSGSSPSMSVSPSPTSSDSSDPTPSASSSRPPSASALAATPSVTPSTSQTPEPGNDSPTSETQTASGGNNGPIIGGVIAAVVVLFSACGVLAFFLVRKRRRNDKKDSDTEVAEMDESTKPASEPLPVAVAVTSTEPASEEPKRATVKGASILDLKQEEVYITDVKLKGLLGKGKFGEVYEGIWSGTTPIALKKLKQEDKQEFENEIVLLRRLNHPNVVRCLGIWQNPQTQETFMALELLRLGSLTNFLRKQGNQSKLAVTDLVEMCINVASGMIYLEQKNIVHRDLGSRNLLVTETDGRYVVKVSDFGLSRQVEENDAVYSSKEGVFPVKWSPPEVINFRQFTSKSDVWSFGITMWEIFEFGRVPYPTMSNEECVAQVMKGYRLAQPDSCPDSVYTIMMGCWAHDPSLRPSFKLIHESLVKVLQELKGEQEEEEFNTAQDDPDKNYSKGKRDETYNNLPKDTYENYNNNKKADETYNNNQQNAYNTN